eukprot:gene15957-21652_t
MKSESVEILLHNLSHSDLVIHIAKPDVDEVININSNTKSAFNVARPKFGDFRQVSEKLYKKIQSLTKENQYVISKYPYEHTTNPKIGQTSSDIKEVVLHETESREANLGFDLSNKDSWVMVKSNALRVRENQNYSTNLNNYTSNSSGEEESAVIGVYFPLLSMLLEKWLHILNDNNNNCKKTVILISGRGQPINNKSNERDNSTKYTAKLIKLFIHLIHPDIKNELLPVIDGYRDKLAEHDISGKWKENMGLTISFADGSSARISAINACLKYYRPAYMHFWQLKRFWRENKVCENDIECHSYEEIATEPALTINKENKLDTNLSSIVEEMKQFKSDISTSIAAANGNHDLLNFWLRKSKKLVLSVLMVQKKGEDKPRLFRGTNMEVSMPTGSLCAERNVIGSALASDITLTRKDIKMIAVYSASISESSNNYDNINNSSAVIDYNITNDNIMDNSMNESHDSNDDPTLNSILSNNLKYELPYDIARDRSNSSSDSKLLSLNRPSPLLKVDGDMSAPLPLTRAYRSDSCNSASSVHSQHSGGNNNIPTESPSKKRKVFEVSSHMQSPRSNDNIDTIATSTSVTASKKIKKNIKNNNIHNNNVHNSNTNYHQNESQKSFTFTLPIASHSYHSNEDSSDDDDDSNDDSIKGSSSAADTHAPFPCYQSKSFRVAASDMNPLK